MSIQVIVPTIGESITEADILAWKKSTGEFVEIDEAILELESDKATLDVNAPCSGILTIIKQGGNVKVGDIIASIEEDKTTEKPPSKPIVETKPLQKEIAQTTEKILSPVAKKIVAENNIAVENIAGTGKDGRITKEDVSQPVKFQSTAEPKTLVETSTTNRDIKVEKMSRLRKTIAQRLVEAQQTAAMLTTFNEVDMSVVMEMRKQYKELFKDKFDVNLGFMSFFAKAVIMALTDLPVVNAQIDGENIKYHNYVDLGIAVSTPKGLVVPIIRNAESMSFNEIEKDILNLALKGRDSKLTPEEMTGGTFTITNGGVFGSMLSTPILNRPQSAILGMHNIIQRPVAVNGQVEIRPIMYLALSYDHRIIDGKEAVTFLVKIKQLIEDPTRILLGL